MHRYGKMQKQKLRIGAVGVGGMKGNNTKSGMDRMTDVDLADGIVAGREGVAGRRMVKWWNSHFGGAIEVEDAVVGGCRKWNFDVAGDEEVHDSSLR
jgi:hypothetical protein